MQISESTEQPEELAWLYLQFQFTLSSLVLTE